MKPIKKEVVKNPTVNEPQNTPQKKKVILLWLLSFITLGIYIPIWYIKRAKEFDNLKTQKTLNKKIPITALILISILLISIAIINFAYNPDTNEPSTAFIIIGLTVLLVVIAYIALYIYLAFKSRAILNQALTNKGVTRKISGFFTLIFNFLYLQYEINRIIDDKENEPRKGPWVCFAILILLAIITPIIFIALSWETIKSAMP